MTIKDGSVDPEDSINGVLQDFQSPHFIQTGLEAEGSVIQIP